MKYRTNAPGKMMRGLNYMFLACFTFICTYPFYYIFIYSVSIPVEAARGGIYLVPKGFTFVNYVELFQQNNIFHAFIVSISRTLVGTVVSVLGTAMFAFAITKLKRSRKLVYRLTISTLYLNAGIIPWYITIKSYHLVDTFWVYILPGLISAFNVVLVKTYMEQLPQALEESAMIDGAGLNTIFWKLILPLSIPVLATIAIFTAVGQWNSWQDNFFFNDGANLLTLQMLLLNYLTEQTANFVARGANQPVGALDAARLKLTPESIRMTITMIVTLPILFVYPFFQRYFLSGILLGSVKE